MSTLLCSSRMAEDLLISFVMVVVASSCEYGELPRSSSRWHLPAIITISFTPSIYLSAQQLPRLSGEFWKATRAFSASVLTEAS